MRINTCSLEKRFYCCKGSHSITVIGMWDRRLKSKTKWRHHKEGRSPARKVVCLASPWGDMSDRLAGSCRPGRARAARIMGVGIALLLRFLEAHVDRCGEVIEIRTNISAFERYIRKRCFPKGLGRESYVKSVAIHRYLVRTGEGRELAPRELKAFFIC